jgi:hypothetical protein
VAVRNGPNGLHGEAYAVNNIEDGTTLFVGKVTAGGTWMVQRYNSATGVVDYANRSNNTAVADYSSAWTGRAGLVYGAFDTLSGV